MKKLLDFWAPWCQPCKMMAPIFDELKKEYEGTVEFEEHNVDENGPEVQKYNVMSIPTYVILKDGVEVGRKIGFTPKAELVKLLSV